MNTMNQVLSIEIALKIDKNFNTENYEAWEKSETVYNCTPPEAKAAPKSLYQFLRSLFLIFCQI